MFETALSRGRLNARRGWRSEAASSVMAERIRELKLSGRALVVDDDAGTVTNALAAAGIETFEWHRRAVHGQLSMPWVPVGPFDNAAVRLPIGREALEMLLHAVASQLRPHGRVFVYGTNDEGIRSAARTIEGLFGNVATLDTRRHSRLLYAERPIEIAGLRRELSEWRLEVEVDLPGGPVRLVSYPGVFAHGKLDRGSQMLISILPPIPEGACVLDFGCGVGVIAAAVLQGSPRAHVDLLDVSALAIEAARENVPTGRYILGDGLRAVADSRYDFIISNPPIHTGKGEDFRVLSDLIEQSPGRLRKGGSILLVVQRTVPAQDLLRGAFDSVSRVSESPQFTVWRGTSPNRRQRMVVSSGGS